MNKVWGNDFETMCAWCLNKKATKEYVGLMAGVEHVLYQVCNTCYDDSPNLVTYDVNKFVKENHG